MQIECGVCGHKFLYRIQGRKGSLSAICPRCKHRNTIGKTQILLGNLKRKLVKKKTQLMYLCTLFEKYGIIRIAKRKRKDRQCPSYQLEILVKHEDREVPRRVKKVLEIGKVYRRLDIQKPAYYWIAYGYKAGAVLQFLYPYLRTKRKHAKIAFEFENRVTKRGRANLDESEIEYRETLRNQLSSL